MTAQSYRPCSVADRLATDRLPPASAFRARLLATVFLLAAVGLLATTPAPVLAAPQNTATSNHPAEGDEPPSQTPPIAETITVTANREPAFLDSVGSSVTVVGREEIERRNPLFVADLLRTIPGIEITQTGGAGQVSSVRLRGGTAAQVLVLVDGVRANTTNNGDVDFAHLDASNLERVEVLRGPQAVYGSEAMSGVIALTTSRARGDGRAFSFGASAESGSRDHQRYGVDLGGAFEALNFRVAYSDLSTDAVSQLAIENGEAETDPYELSTLSARATIGSDGGASGDGSERFGKRASQLSLSVRDYSGDVAVDGFGVEDLNAFATTDGSYVGLYGESQFSDRWHQSLRVGLSETDLLGTDPDTFFNNYSIRSENLLFEAQADLDLTAQQRLNIGASHEERQGENLGSFDEQANLEALFLQHQWARPATSGRGDLHLTAAVRYDDHSVFGDETTFRVTGVSGFGREGTTAGRLRASYGTAFRAPNFNELYFPFAGDRNLEPETSEGWDLGWMGYLGPVQVDIGVFDLDFENLIQFDLGSFQFANINQAQSRGIEGQAALDLARRVRLQLTHTYNETEDESSGGPLARRPRNRSTALLQWTGRNNQQSRASGVSGAAHATGLLSARTSAAVSAVWVRHRVDSSGLAMDDYVRVDATATMAVLSWLDVYVRLENAFDRDYQEVPGFTTPGATFVGGVRLRY